MIPLSFNFVVVVALTIFVVSISGEQRLIQMAKSKLENSLKIKHEAHENSKLRTEAVGTLTGYFTMTYYKAGSCNTPLQSLGQATGICYQFDSNEYVQVNCADGISTANYYSDSACTIPSGSNPEEYPATGACVATNSYAYNFGCTTSTTPSYPKNFVVLQEYSSSTCAGSPVSYFGLSNDYCVSASGNSYKYEYPDLYEYNAAGCTGSYNVTSAEIPCIPTSMSTIYENSLYTGSSAASATMKSSVGLLTVLLSFFFYQF